MSINLIKNLPLIVRMFRVSLRRLVLLVSMISEHVCWQCYSKSRGQSLGSGSRGASGPTRGLETARKAPVGQAREARRAPLSLGVQDFTLPRNAASQFKIISPQRQRAPQHFYIERESFAGRGLVS